MAKPTRQNVADAVRILSGSESGRASLRALLAWIDSDGATLDAKNQTAVATILMGVWGDLAGSTIDEMRDELSNR